MIRKIYISTLSLLLFSVAYPCINCSLPIANGGDDYIVVNGGVGVLDGSESYDPDNFELQLSYFWFSKENQFSYCGDINTDVCSGGYFKCEDYEEIYTTKLDCEANGAQWVAAEYVDHLTCWSAGYIWAKTNLQDSTSCVNAGNQWNAGTITVEDFQTESLKITKIDLETIEPDTFVTVKLYLIVNDGGYNSNPDQVNIQVTPLSENTIPKANAGIDRSFFKGDGTEVQLNGSSSVDSTNTGIMNYTWSLIGDDDFVFSESDSTSPSWYFTILDSSETGATEEELEFQLVVNDGLSENNSEPDTVKIDVIYNFIPIADAGSDTTYPVGTAEVTLRGTYSYDIDGPPGSLTYQWQQVSGAPVVLSSTDADTLSFSPPQSPDTLLFRLVVNDTHESSSAWSAHDLFISEYANGDHDTYFEIYNGTGDTVNFSNYELWIMSYSETDGAYENGYSDWPNRKLVFDPQYNEETDPTFHANLSYKKLTGLSNYQDCEYVNAADELLLPNNSTLVIFQSKSDYSVVSTGSKYAFNNRYLEWNSSGLQYIGGNDAIGLAKNGILIDAIGNNGGYDKPWPVAGDYDIKDNTLVRKRNIVRGDPNWWVDEEGNPCDRPDYVVCKPGSAGKGKADSEWNVYPVNTYDYAGGHNCTSCDSEIEIIITDNKAPEISYIMSTDYLGNNSVEADSKEIVQGYKCYLKGVGSDSTTNTDLLTYYWSYPENIQLINSGERFTDINGNGIYDDQVSTTTNYVDSNDNLIYDSGDTLVYFETSTLLPGEYIISFAVSDGQTASAIDSIAIVVLKENTRPVVNAGDYSAITYNEADTVLMIADTTFSDLGTFDTTNTDEGLYYFWHPFLDSSRTDWIDLGIQSDSILVKNQDTLSFIMPVSLDTNRIFTFEFTACDSKSCGYSSLRDEFACSDGLGECAHDTVDIQMINPQYPVAIISDVGNPPCTQGFDRSHLCTLSSISTDPQPLDTLTYKWSSDDVYIASNTDSILSFSPHKKDSTSSIILNADTTFTIALEVSDGTHTSLQSTFRVSVAATWPYANAVLDGYYINKTTNEVNLVTGVEYSLNGYSFDDIGGISGDPNLPEISSGYYNANGVWKSATKTEIARYVNKELTAVEGYKFAWDYNNYPVTNIFRENENSIVSTFTPLISNNYTIYFTVTDTTDENSFDATITEGCELDDRFLILKEPVTDGDPWEVNFNSSIPISAFEIYFDGATVANIVLGGQASTLDFNQINASGGISAFDISGNTISPGCGILLKLDLTVTGETVGISEIVVGDADGIGVPFRSYSENYFDIVSPRDSVKIKVNQNEVPEQILNYIYTTDGTDCITKLEEYKVLSPAEDLAADAALDCWMVRVGTNPDTITVQAGAEYTLDGSHSYDNTPTGVIKYSWESLSNILFLSDASLEDSTATPTVVMPDSIGKYYGFSLRVHDGQKNDGEYFWSERDTIVLKTTAPSTIKPPSEFYAKVLPGDNFIQLVWSNESERELDSLTGYRDFEGYNIYRSTDQGETWGGESDSIFNYDEEFAGWRPYVQFDMSENEDTSACLFTIDLLGGCPSGVTRKKNIIGSDPVMPWFQLGDNSGLQASYIDTNVFDGIEYTYSITAYDMGLQTNDTIYTHQYTYKDIMAADTFNFYHLDFGIDSSYVELSKEYYIIDTLDNNGLGSSNNDPTGQLEIHSETINWDIANPGHYTYFGQALGRRESSIGSSNGSTNKEDWDPNYVSIRPGYHASNISYPDLDEFVSQDCQAIGNGNQFFEIVNDYQLAEYLTENDNNLIRLEIQADQLNETGTKQNIFENYSTENPYLYIYNVEKKYPPNKAPYYAPIDVDYFTINDTILSIEEVSAVNGEFNFTNPVWSVESIDSIHTNISNFTTAQMIIKVDSVLNLPGADTTTCNSEGTCILLPDYLIDPSPVLYKDNTNLNDNWTDILFGVRFRFDDANNNMKIVNSAPDPKVVIKDLFYSDTLLSHILDHEGDKDDHFYLEYNGEPIKRRPPYAYKIIFGSEAVDTALSDIASHSNCDIYPPFFPFRIYNIITGKKVGLRTYDGGIYNSCANVPIGNTFYENCDESKHPGYGDCVWERNEEIQMAGDIVSSSLGNPADTNAPDDESYASWIYKLYLDFELRDIDGYNLRSVWSEGSAYSKNDIVEHAGMLWQTIEDITGGTDLSKSGPNLGFFDETKININPWSPLYPWKDGDSLIIIPERWYVDGDYWIANLALLGQVDEITQKDINKIKVVPNPFIVSSGFMEAANKKIRFTHLPTQCAIYIYTVSGEFVNYIEHDDLVDGNEFWDLKNRSGQDVAPGLYIYTVESKSGLKKLGKFAIVR